MDSEASKADKYGFDTRAWLTCAVLTLATTAFAFTFYRSPADMLPALRILPAWMAAAILLAVIGSFSQMIRNRVASPSAEMLRLLQKNWRAILGALVLIALAGQNLIAFMWNKPLLNQLVPFWADPMLADIDRMLFLGRDPWTLLVWANFPFAGVIYHPVWFGSIVIALLLAVFAPSSPQKSAIIVSYFVLWSLVAPLVHTALPAAGPIFYEAMGYGPRFAEMQHNPETAAVASYLWEFYASGSFGAGNGISAMPSMHVTTSSWVVIATFTLRRNWLPFALTAWLVIFTLSIALGWHYALDGVVGAFAAIAVYRLCLLIFSRRADNPAIDARPIPNPA